VSTNILANRMLRGAAAAPGSWRRSWRRSSGRGSTWRRRWRGATRVLCRSSSTAPHPPRGAVAVCAGVEYTEHFVRHGCCRLTMSLLHLAAAAIARGRSLSPRGAAAWGVCSPAVTLELLHQPTPSTSASRPFPFRSTSCHVPSRAHDIVVGRQLRGAPTLHRARPGVSAAPPPQKWKRI
jgi:hypothetical protein